MSIGRLMTLLTLVALALLGAAGTAQYWAAERASQQRELNDTRKAADGAARALSQLVGLLNQTLDGLARDPTLAATLASGSPTVIQAEQERLTQIVPGALLVRLMPEKLTAPDESQTPRMGFADLDMVRRATTGTPPVALHGANTSDAHLALARRLESGGGVLLASVSTKLVQEAMGGSSAAGALELRQESMALAYQGDTALKSSAPGGEVPVPGTVWKIAYWPPGGGGWRWLWLVVPTLLAAAALLALTRRLLLWLKTAYALDSESLGLLILDLLHGKALGSYPLKIAEHEVFVMRIADLKRTERILPQSMIPGQGEEKGPAIVFGAASAKESIQVEEGQAVTKVPASIFRAYDIRGVVGETLNAEIVQVIGRAIGSEAHERGELRVIIARDGRLSSPELAKALAAGLKSTGRTVIDLGVVPTPVLYYATHVLNTKSGVVVTGSHNPADYNGLKIVIAGETLAEQGIQKLRERIEKHDFVPGVGKIETRDVVPDYIERIVQDMQIGRPMKVVVDCANGVAAKVAPALLAELECELVPLYCEVDGHFPNHHPDPSKPENLAALIDTVRREKADLGVAFDGDGDRLAVVDSSGKIIWPDRQMMLFAADVLCRQPGADIIFDVKCSRHLGREIVKGGGRPLMWKTGHSLLKAKMKETGAQLAGEMSGHICFKERWYGFDDGIYAAARLIEILSGDPRDSAEVFADLPDSVNTPELSIPMDEDEKFRFIDELKVIALFPDARTTDLDGLRLDFVDGWGLVRASNTTPALTLRFEADNQDALARIQEQFRALMLQVKPELSLPF